MHLSSEVESLLPGEEDVGFYEEHGYYVTPKVLPDDVSTRRSAVPNVTGQVSATGVFPSAVVSEAGSPATARPSATRSTRRSRIARSAPSSSTRSSGRLRPASPGPARSGSGTTSSFRSRLPPARGPVVGWHTDRASG